MAWIRINFSSAQSASRDLQRLSKDMGKIQSGITALQRGLDSEVQRRHQIAAKLKAANASAKDFQTKAGQLHSLLDRSVDSYRATEAWLNQHTPDNRNV